MGRNFNRKLHATAGVLLLAGLTAGCAAFGGDQAAADKLVTDAAQQIVGSGQLTFQGTSSASVDGYPLPQLPSFEGHLTGGKQLVVAVRSGPAATNEVASATSTTFTRESVGAWKATAETGATTAPLLPWNPLPWLEQLPQLKRQSSLDAKQSDAATRVVRVELEPSEVKRLVTEQLQQERQRVQERFTAEAGKAGGTLSAATTGDRGELSATAAQAFAQLDQMLSTLQAEGELTLWLDRATSHPTKLSLTTHLHYYNGGSERSETASTDYTFGDEGSNALLPS